MIARIIAFVILFLCAFGAIVLAQPQKPNESSTSYETAAFSRRTLIQRFDNNSDGSLDEIERRTLRAAFGGIDVPMLPTTPFRYSLEKRPSHIRDAQLSDADNTPDHNQLTDHGATLGRVLFYDKQLSKNNTIACASCHLQEKGFSDPRRVSVGYEGGQTGRNAMALANLRYTNLKGSQPGFFWDERAVSLEAQALMPIQDKVEMGMELTDLEKKLGGLPYYPPLFASAFGSSEITSQRIAMGIAQFMRAMVSWDAKFDRAAQATEATDYSVEFKDFSFQENLGKSLFIDGVDGIAEIGCAHCHMPPTFGMPKAFNNGLDLRYSDQGLGALDRPSNDPFTPSNDGKFKAPSLRNIALTAPFMHDGRFDTLEQVMEHYSVGVHPHENVGLAFAEDNDQAKPSGFQLSDVQKSAIIAFLQTLTDESFIRDPKYSDPFVRQSASAN